MQTWVSNLYRISLCPESMRQRLLGVGTKYFLPYIVILHRKAVPMGSTHCKHSLTLYLWIRKPRLLPPIIGVMGPLRELPVTLTWIWSNSSSVISEYRSNSSLSPNSLRLRWMVETLTSSISAVFWQEKKSERKYSSWSLEMPWRFRPGPNCVVVTDVE